MKCRGSIPIGVCPSGVVVPIIPCTSYRKLLLQFPCAGAEFNTAAEVRCVCHYLVESAFIFTSIPTFVGDGAICVRYTVDLTPEIEDEQDKTLEVTRYVLRASGEHNIWFPQYVSQVIDPYFSLEAWTTSPNGMTIDEELEFEIGIIDCGTSVDTTSELCVTTGLEDVPEEITPMPESGTIPEVREPWPQYPLT